MGKIKIRPGQTNGSALVPVRINAKTVIWVKEGQDQAKATALFQEATDRSRNNKTRTPYIPSKNSR